MDGFSWLLCSWITFPAPEKSRSLSQNPRPTRAKLCPSQQDSDRDNPHYESLLVVEVPESWNHNIIWMRTQLLAVILYYIDTYILDLILLYYLDIELRESTREWTLIGCYVTSLLGWPLIGCYVTSLKGWMLIGCYVTSLKGWKLIGCYVTSLKGWTLIGCYVTSLKGWTLNGIVGVVVFNPQAPKSHCLPFLSQENTKIEMYVSIRLNIYDPLSMQIHVFTGEIVL